MKNLFFLVVSFYSLSLLSQDWETVVLLPGRSPIKQIEIIDDNNIYVSSQYYELHHWNGSEWKSVGNFNPNFNGVFDYRSANEIYAIHNGYINGNTSTEYNYIAKWNGTSWSNFGNLNQPKTIYNFKVFSESEIYAVGEIDDIDDYRWRSVAKYDGSKWIAIGKGDPNAGTYGGNNSLWVNNANDIYSKHDGYRSGGVQRVKHWDGNSWTVLFSSEDEIDGVDRLHVVSKNEIYTNTWNKEGNLSGIGYWDGNYWRMLGDIQTDMSTGNFYGSVDFLFVNSNEIYAFGSGLRKRNVFTYQVAVWNGSKWNNLGDLNANNPVTAAFYKDGYLYVGGSFTESGKTLIKKINAKKVLSSSTFKIDNTIKLFPNPVNKVGHLSIKAKRIQIFDVTGKKVLQFNNQSKFDVTTLQSGVYVLKVIDDNNKSTIQKMIKN